MTCETCRTLLSDGLDLCVRARAMDAQDRTNAQMAISSAPPEWWKENLPRRVARHNALFPDQPMSTRSGTIPLWLEDQYEKDLAEWERQARHHLQQGRRPMTEPTEQQIEAAQRAIAETAKTFPKTSSIVALTYSQRKAIARAALTVYAPALADDTDAIRAARDPIKDEATSI